MKSKLFAVLCMTAMGMASVAMAQPSQSQSPQQPSMQSQNAQAGMQQDLQRAQQDIQSTFGFMPSFFKAMPEEALPGAWEDFKNTELNQKTAIPNRYKELIGLAVASQIPCRYCSYAHSESANSNGASSMEIKEAVAMSAIARKWTTLWSGYQISDAELRRDADRISQSMQASQHRQPASSPANQQINTPQQAYSDMQHMFGYVPNFMRMLPQASVVGAWKELKELPLNPNSALPGKYKELITLAVASQMSCNQCVYFFTKTAKAQGASDSEVREAVNMASLTRHWSSVLNGMQVDESTFRSEFHRMLSAPQQPAPRAPASSESESNQ